jgi:hypothetical protein
VSALARVRHARIVLLCAIAASAILGAAAVGAGVLALASAADLLVPLPFSARRLVLPAAVAAAAASLLVAAWRGRHARSLGRVALYLEERLPQLRFALATAVAPAVPPSDAAREALERAVASVDARGALWPPVARAIAVRAAALVAALIALAAVPAGTLARILDPRPGDILLRPTPGAADAPVPNRLVPIVVRVEPPRYAGRDPLVLEDPATVAALPGSRIEVRGRGASRGATDSLGASITPAGGGQGRDLALRVDGDSWSAAIVMPAEPAILRLKDRAYDRLVVLEPTPDEPPVLALLSPIRDSTFAEPKGKLDIDVQIQDDIGLARAEIELLYTSGGGEQFETKRIIVSRASFNGTREARLRAAIVLDTMGLRPGDVLHVRAVAWDRNDVTGPGKGESETRTIRIRDPRDLSDVNITAAAAAAIDTSILSQRMLIMRAETLLVQRPQLEPEEYTRRSVRLSVQQGALRQRVLSIIYELENVEGVGFVGHTPSSLVLREAAEEMRVAEWELSIAQVPIALVHMRKALALLEKIRDANRYWLRGMLTTTPVEIEQVRLTGRDRANVGPRDPRERPEDPRRELLQRLNRAIALLDSDARAAGDSLQLIFAASLTEARDVSETLGQAIEAMQRGEDARAALIAARRRLERRVEREGTLSSWFGTP